jgi:hypothetical protein
MSMISAVNAGDVLNLLAEWPVDPTSPRLDLLTISDSTQCEVVKSAYIKMMLVTKLETLNTLTGP